MRGGEGGGGGGGEKGRRKGRPLLSATKESNPGNATASERTVAFTRMGGLCLSLAYAEPERQEMFSQNDLLPHDVKKKKKKIHGVQILISHKKEGREERDPPLSGNLVTTATQGMEEE